MKRLVVAAVVAAVFSMSIGCSGSSSTSAAKPAGVGADGKTAAGKKDDRPAPVSAPPITP